MNKLNLRDPIFVLVILLLLCFVGWQWNAAKVQRLERQEDNRLHQERVEKLKTDVALSEAKISALEKERKMYTDSARTQQRARMQEIQAYKTTIASLKVKVLPQIDTSSDLSQLISTQDLVIAKQDSLLHATGLAHSAEIVNLESQLAEKGRQLMTKDAINELLQSRNQELEKEVKKGQRGKRVRNWIIGGLVVWGIVESVK